MKDLETRDGTGAPNVVASGRDGDPTQRRDTQQWTTKTKRLTGNEQRVYRDGHRRPAQTRGMKRRWLFLFLITPEAVQLSSSASPAGLPRGAPKPQRLKKSTRGLDPQAHRYSLTPLLKYSVHDAHVVFLFLLLAKLPRLALPLLCSASHFFFPFFFGSMFLCRWEPSTLYLNYQFLAGLVVGQAGPIINGDSSPDRRSCLSFGAGLN